MERQSIHWLTTVFLSIIFFLMVCSLFSATGELAGPYIEEMVNSSEMNLISNGSFEEGMDGWSSPFRPSGSPEVALDDTVSRTGNASLRLDTFTPTDRIFINMVPRLSVSPGEIYELEGWVKTDLSSGSGSAHFRVQFKGIDGQNIATGHLQYSERVRGKSDWTLVRHVFTIPATTEYLAVELGLENALGSAWWDDITLKRVNPDLNLIVNGSFEDGLNGWSVHRFSGDGQVYVDEEGLHIITESSSDRITVHQTVYGLPAGSPFSFQTFVKTEGMEDSTQGAYVRLQFRDATGGYTRSHLISRFYHDADEWTPIGLDFIVPEGTVRVQFEIFSEHAAGKASFKEAQLVSLDEDFEVVELQAEVHPSGAVLLRWTTSAEISHDEPLIRYRVYRSFDPEVNMKTTVPLAIVSEPMIFDRTVRSHRTYYYRVVPEFVGGQVSSPSNVAFVETGDLPGADGPINAEAVAQKEGVRLSWTFADGTRVNHLDLYRYEGEEPQDFDVALSDSQYIGRAGFNDTVWLDSAVSLDDTDRLSRTWYLIRSASPELETVQHRIVPVTGIIPRIPVTHDGEHPLLVVTKSQFERARMLAETDIIVSQMINFEITRSALATAARWSSPQTLPGKDDNSGHASLAQSARILGLAYQFEPDREEFARAARNILMTYADKYVTYPKLTNYGGRVTYQSLNESSWLVQIAWTYDLIYDYLTPQEREHIENNLLREAVAVVQSYPRGRLNWQIWHNAGIGAVAFVLKDEALISEVLETGNEAARKLFDEGLFADGLWWEQSIGYHNYTLSAWVWLALIAGNNGYDLFELRVGDRTFRTMFDSILHHAFQDLSHPAIGDTNPNVRLTSSAWIFGPALMKYNDPRYAWVLQQSGLGGLSFPAVFFLEQFRETDIQPIVIGSTDFAPQGRNDYGSSLFRHTGMALLRGSVRQEHNLGVSLIYKPDGTFMGHQHADNLNINLTALNHQWLAGTGTFPYSPGVQDQRHGTFARHTAAKNSLVVDGWSQIPQRNNTGLFTTDGAVKSRGYLDLYVPGPTVQLVRAGSDAVYPGVHLERTLLMTDGYVLDVYDAVGSRDHRFDWIIHVTGDLQESYTSSDDAIEAVLEWSEGDGSLGHTDGMQYLTVEQVLENVATPTRLRWVSSSVGTGQYLDQWIIPTGENLSAHIGTALWTVSPGNRKFLSAQTNAESARYVTIFSPSTGQSFVESVTWVNEEKTFLRVVHQYGEDLITLPPLDQKGGPVHFVRHDEDGMPTDLLMAADRATKTTCACVRVESSHRTSVSAGIVDGVWVLHHEGSGLGSHEVSLIIRGLPLSAVSLLNVQNGIATAIDGSSSSDGFGFQLVAGSRQTIVFAEPELAETLDLTVTLGR